MMPAIERRTGLSATHKRIHRGYSKSRRVIPIVDKNAFGGAFEIFVLPGIERPQQQAKRAQPECECGGDDEGDTVHDALPRASRNAFNVTTSDEPAMVAAAIKGDTRPIAASGMAVRL